MAGEELKVTSHSAAVHPICKHDDDGDGDGDGDDDDSHVSNPKIRCVYWSNNLSLLSTRVDPESVFAILARFLSRRATLN